MKSTETYSLRQVVELTGLSEFTLRGWEQRYGAFSPNRTGTGRRRYSAVDLQKAILLRELVKRNHRIGEIANLPVAKLDKLLEQEAGEKSDAEPEVSDKVQLAFRHVTRQEWDELEDLLDSQTRRAKPAQVLEEWILPLLQQLTKGVEEGHITIAQEHVLSALVRSELHRLRERAPKRGSRARVLIAAPEGDFHDLGILIAHVIVGIAGTRSLYLGPNTPKNELCETAHRYGATHLLLGSTISRKEGAKEDFYTYVHYLDKHLSSSVQLFLGGRNGKEFRGTLQREHRVFSNLSELETAMQSLN